MGIGNRPPLSFSLDFEVLSVLGVGSKQGSLELSESRVVVGLEPLNFLRMGLTEFGLVIESLALSLSENRLVGRFELVDNILVTTLDLLEDEDLSFGVFLWLASSFSAT